VTTTPDSREQGSASIGELLSDISTDISTLMRQEVELAKAELRQSATQAGKGAGMLGGSAVSAHLAVVFVALACWWGLGNAIGRGWAGLVVAVVLALIAAGLAAFGRKEIQSVTGLPKTASTVKKIPDAVKGNEGNAR
jgi:Putative Actinobacterial Holin-X, holin superfamily III